VDLTKKECRLILLTHGMPPKQGNDGLVFELRGAQKVRGSVSSRPVAAKKKIANMNKCP
jgi:hypothetical protein